MIWRPFQEKDAASPYIILAQNLLLDILSGRLAPGQKLPAIRQLAERNNVCMATTQRALDTLQREGIVITIRTTGKHVTSDVLLINHWKRHYIDIETSSLIEKLLAIGFSEAEIAEEILNRLPTQMQVK